MKRWMILLAVALFVATPTYAQNASKVKPEPKPVEGDDEAASDAKPEPDDDKELDDEARAEKFFSDNDTDKNGFIEKAELKKNVVDSFRESRSFAVQANWLWLTAYESFYRMDKDKDGKLSKAECTPEAVKNRGQNVKPTRDVSNALNDEFFEIADTDKDDKITKAEYRAFFPKISDGQWIGVYQSFLLEDTNDDGVVGKQERAKLFDTHVTQHKELIPNEKDLAAFAAEAMALFDKDKDGFLNKDEHDPVATVHPDQFERDDTNADGKIDKEECGNIFARQFDFDWDKKQKAKTKFARLDSDKDGEISKAEYKAQLGEDPKFGRWFGKYMDFRRMDTNDDDKVSLAEFTANELAKEEPELSDKDYDALVDVTYEKMDTDSDGFITVEEAKANGDKFDQKGFDKLDTDSDGKISKKEFLVILKNPVVKRTKARKVKPDDESEPDGEEVPARPVD